MGGGGGGGGGEGGQMTHAHVLLQVGYRGLAVSSSIGSREEHITLYFDINPYFNKSKSVWKRLCLQLHRGVAPPMDVR